MGGGRGGGGGIEGWGGGSYCGSSLYIHDGFWREIKQHAIFFEGTFGGGCINNYSFSFFFPPRTVEGITRSLGSSCTFLLCSISSPSKNECNQKAKGLLCGFYCALISFYPLQPLAPRAHFFSCFDLKMQWKYLAFR